MVLSLCTIHLVTLPNDVDVIGLNHKQKGTDFPKTDSREFSQVGFLPQGGWIPGFYWARRAQRGFPEFRKGVSKNISGRFLEREPGVSPFGRKGGTK